METGTVTDEDHHGTLFRQVDIVVVPEGLVRFVPPGSRATALTSWDVWRGVGGENGNWTGVLVESVPATDEDHHGTLFRQVAIVAVPCVEDGGLVRFVPPRSRAAGLISWDVWRSMSGEGTPSGADLRNGTVALGGISPWSSSGEGTPSGSDLRSGTVALGVISRWSSTARNTLSPWCTFKNTKR